MTEQMPQPTSRYEFESKLITKAWKDEAFKQELISNPNAVYSRELGHQIAEDITIQVLEETPRTRYLVIPRNPADTQVEEVSDEALEAVAGGGAAKPDTITFVIGCIVI